MSTRDYGLIGSQAQKAVEQGLADADWYTSPVSREEMRQLMVRKNGPGIRDSVIWFGLIFGSAFLTIYFWGTWWFIFPYIIYAVLYASTSDSRWHESSHGTAFKSDWMNNILYEIASFMVLRQSAVWRWSHTRHHSDTLVRGRDPEIAVPRPPNFLNIFLNIFAVKSSIAEFKKILIHASGRIDKNVATFLPPSENKKVIRIARIYLLIFISVIALSIYFKTILPLMFIGIPTFVGTWLMPVYGMTQHAGLEENVLDHRVNCRTVYMNRVHRFLYWNMNYHVEHHMFPMIPYHALPKLHDIIKEDCIEPHRGLFHVWKEIIPALIKQRKDPSYFVKREVKTSSQQAHTNYQRYSRSLEDLIDNKLIQICDKTKIPINEVIRLDYSDNTFAIYRTGENDFYATEGICTHGNTHLAEGLIMGDQIECPKHNGRFDITDGTVQRQPVCLGLDTYKVVVKEDMLYLDLESGKLAKDKAEILDYQVVSNKNVATYIKELTLKPVNGNPEINFTPGDYIHLEIPAHQTMFESFEVEKQFSKEWKNNLVFENYAFNHSKTRRNYSLATNPEVEDILKFNVRIALPPEGKNCNAGIGSTFVFNLKPGDKVQISGPYGDFHIKETEKEMVYVGGGAGMAPLRSHISYLLDTLKTKRKISFWYGARSLSELYYDDYFNKLAEKHENFSFHVALSEPSEEDSWNSHTGFIHQILDDNYLKKESDLNKKEFYLCGPPAMIKAMHKTLEGHKISEENIAFDEF